MKKIILLILTFLCGAFSNVSAQVTTWNILRYSIVGDTLWHYDAMSASDDHNFTVSASYFLDSNNYTVYTNNHICFLRSTDAGYTWLIQDPKLAPDSVSDFKTFSNVYMIDSLHVIAIGDTGLMRRTSDGGATWLRNDYPTVHVLTGIHFSDSKTGILVGGAVLATTSDGGASWQGVPNPPYAWMTSCHSYGNGRFRVFNFDKGLIHTTTDNWKTWDSLPIRSTYDTLTGYQGIEACEFRGQDTIIAHGALYIEQNLPRRSRILLSTDGGKSWTEQLERVTYAWPDLISVSDDGLWIGGGNGDGMLTSTNHGTTWRDDTVTVSEPPPWRSSQMLGIQVLNSTRAIALLNGDIVDLNLSKLSVQQYEREVFGTHIYPNPASRFVNIQSEVGNVPIYITDMLGREPIVGQLNSDGTLHLDISKLRSGVYQVNMFFNNAMLHITNLIVIPE